MFLKVLMGWPRNLTAIYSLVFKGFRVPTVNLGNLIHL